MTTELAAGPELDERVAVQVFGAVRVRGAVMWDGTMPLVAWSYQVGDITAYYTALPAYSTDGGAAWLVVEHFAAQARYLWLSYEAGNTAMHWKCAFAAPPECQATAETAPLAICRAALAAVAQS